MRQLMAHGAATNSIEIEAPRQFDRVARRFNVDYAFIKPGRTNTCFFQKRPGGCGDSLLF